MKLKGLYLFCFILFIITVNLGDALRLSQRNRAILKSIKSEDGDVIDCVDIYHQPAFDHPLLKDHIIKMIPNYHPERFLAENKLSEVESNDNKQITQTWQLSGECPEGTVPIRRTENGAITNHKKYMNIHKLRAVRHEYAIARSPADIYNGASAYINLWTPFVERNSEFSLSQLWLVAGSGTNTNTIEAGWIVYPQRYNGSRTARLFVFWTSANYTNGCYDLDCGGFVQTSNQIAVGGTINISGNNPEFSLGIWKDSQNQRWVLQFDRILVGYWPTNIFTTLQGSASRVDWGGEIINENINGRHTTTEMGSGRFPQEGYGRASYFRNLEVIDRRNYAISVPNVVHWATNANCYNITLQKNNTWGNYFYYGGPGRNPPNCP